MAYSKRVKSDPIFVANLEDIINALFNGETPCTLLKSETTRVSLLKYFAGEEYESFKDFDRVLKSHTKRANKKEKITEFLKTNSLEMYPHSSYSIFLQSKNEEYKNKHSELSPKELRGKMTQDWGKMTDKEKAPFEKIYQEKKSEFIEQVRDIDPEMVSVFDKSQAQKPPPRPYTLFVTEQMKEIRKENSKISNTDVMRLAGEKWRSMSETEKKVYYEKCGAEMPTSSNTKKKTDKPEVKKPEETKPIEVKPATKSDKKETPPKVSNPKTSPKKDEPKQTPTPKGKKTVVQSESESEDVKPPTKGKRTLAPKNIGGKKQLDLELDNSDHTDATEEE
jgi:hypothetical protein